MPVISLTRLCVSVCSNDSSVCGIGRSVCGISKVKSSKRVRRAVSVQCVSGHTHSLDSVIYAMRCALNVGLCNAFHDVVPIHR